jgi:RND family efflux transporter MFP subunit
VFRRPLTVFAATLAASQFLLACGGTEETKQNALPVAAAPLESARFTDSVDTITTLESVQIVNLASRANGRILRLGVREGQLVKQGQLLMQLDQTQQRAELASAIAAMEANKKDFQRFEYLAKQGAASDFQRDRFREAYISSIQDVKARQADLAFNNLQAPISGVISDLVVKQGDVIQEGDPFTKIIRNDRLFARIDLPAVRSAQVREGQRVILLAPDGSRPLAQGTVDFVDPTVDPTTQGLLVKSVFANPGGILRNGQRLRARVELGAREFPSIPFAAVTQSSGQSFVFVVGSFADLQRLPGQLKKEDIDKLAPPALPSGTQFALQTPVKLGPLENNRYPVLSGVAPGKQVITTNLLKLRHGAPVKVN